MPTLRLVGRLLGTCLPAILAAAATAHAAEPHAALFDETQAVTLFAFDDQSIPYSRNLKLVMRSPEKHPANPVVARGGPGTVDAMGVQFYGSVIRAGEPRTPKAATASPGRSRISGWSSIAATRPTT
jgi:hypothetical protein